MLCPESNQDEKGHLSSPNLGRVLSLSCDGDSFFSFLFCVAVFCTRACVPWKPQMVLGSLELKRQVVVNVRGHSEPNSGHWQEQQRLLTPEPHLQHQP